MSDAQIDGYAAAMFEVARAEDVLGRAVDELFRFSRSVDANPDLRSALTDPGSTGEAKTRIIEELLSGRAHPVTSRLLSLVVEAGLARDLTRIVDAFTARASAAGQAAVAEVRVAAPIDEEQRTRIAEALTRSKGRPVDVKVIVDPSVIGGVVTTIGDEVIDGSVRRRLEQLRASLAG
ncbi:MAG TPA: ATP synthase F1 subunit delta [Mycobacteriales bacterium]|jgi:F-type H+-transporting ATPase subunit delta|nr:ATP synthase F1 subunit delta [Mycobacteriales bacterium]